MKPNIYNYVDYRHYFMDIFTWLKQSENISYRAYARMAGATSPNYYQLIRDHKLQMKPAAVDRLSRSLKLNREETLYFHGLLEFDSAKTHETKDKAFRKLMKLSSVSEISELSEEQYEFFSHWFVPVIRELIVLAEPGTPPEVIAKQVVPSITAKKVEHAVEILQRLNLIVQRSDGAWEMTETVISSPHEVLSVALCNYHSSVIQLGKESIERFERSERDIRGVTLGISNNTYKTIKEKLQDFWEEILDISGKETKVERVYQLSSLLFPLSEKDVHNDQD